MVKDGEIDWPECGPWDTYMEGERLCIEHRASKTKACSIATTFSRQAGSLHILFCGFAEN